MVQVVVYLPSKHKAQVQILVPAERERDEDSI
jgi:hypothetical protein